MARVSPMQTYKHFCQKRCNNVYIFELKTDSPQRAIEQIIEKNYVGQTGGSCRPSN
jgi:hypothetical protein